MASPCSVWCTNGSKPTSLNPRLGSRGTTCFHDEGLPQPRILFRQCHERATTTGLMDIAGSGLGVMMMPRRNPNLLTRYHPTLPAPLSCSHIQCGRL